ncbi:MAG: hypothetical protein AB1505_14345 [Candidatus Latescibacterota bacterium]
MFGYDLGVMGSTPYTVHYEEYYGLISGGTETCCQGGFVYAFWDGNPYDVYRGTPTQDLSTGDRNCAVQASVNTWSNHRDSLTFYYSGAYPALHNDNDDQTTAVFFASFEELGNAAAMALLTFYETSSVIG